jgi:uncharacterized protein YggT (Ycf19 family)
VCAILFTMTDPRVQAYEEEATKAEQSPLPWVLKALRVVVWIVYAIVLATAIMLTLDFVLRLFGANSDNAFVQWVYRSTDRAMQPFRGIFPTHQLGDSSAAVDFSVMFAAIFYFVVAILVDIALRWLSRRLHREARDTTALRQRADDSANLAYAQQQAAQRAAHEAAEREYAARQATADQYAIAQAAANEAIARQAAREYVPPEPVRAKPAPPQPSTSEPDVPRSAGEADLPPPTA